MTAETRTGLLAGLGAYLIWGLLPLYLKLLGPVPAPDVLGHRILWSLLVLTGVVTIARGWPRLKAALANRRLLALLLASAVCIAINWFVYTWAVLNGHVLDTSLGYFINPLVSVAFGVALLGERLSRLQWLAIGCALAGVLVLTVARGSVPLVSLALAFSFGTYGLIRKQAAVDALTGLFVETLLLAPLAAIWLASRAEGSFGWPAPLLALLALGGVLTAVPLLLFGLAARRLKLSTLGLMQYLAPSMVFLQAVFLFGEPLDQWQLTAFLCIWAGLLLYTVSLSRGAVASAGKAR